MPLFFPTHLSSHLSVHRSIYLYIHLSIRLSIHLSIHSFIPFAPGTVSHAEDVAESPWLSIPSPSDTSQFKAHKALIIVKSKVPSPFLLYQMSLQDAT